MAHTQTWNASYETVPADGDSMSEGAQRIRNLKRDIRERIATDHYMDVAGTDADHGEHSKVTFQSPLGADPAPGTNKGALYTKDVSSKAELHFEDEDANVIQITSSGSLSYLPAGVMFPYGGSSAPTGYLLCDGSAVSRTTYATLFAAISTTYGVGNGSTTFNVPDLQGNYPRGKDADSLGDTGGAASVDVSHSHTVDSHAHTGPSHTHNTTLPEGGWTDGGLAGSDERNMAVGTFLSVAARILVSAAGGTGNTGAATPGTDSQGSAAQSVLDPYVVVNYIIKT